MPRLIKNITAELLQHIEAASFSPITVEGEFGDEDYIELNGFIAFTQNFTKAIEVEEFNTLTNYGLLVNQDKEFIELEIDY